MSPYQKYLAVDASPLSTPTLTRSRSGSRQPTHCTEVDPRLSPLGEVISTPHYTPALALPPSALALPAPAKRLRSRISSRIAPTTPQMSEGSSHRGRHLRRGEQLRRNAACVQCRKRRTKCDASKPHCSACVRHHNYLKRTQPDLYPEGQEVQCCYEDESGCETPQTKGLFDSTPITVDAVVESSAGPSRRTRGQKVKRSIRSRGSSASDSGVPADGGMVKDLIARVAGLQAELVSRESPVPPTTSSTCAPTPSPLTSGLGLVDPNVSDAPLNTLDMPYDFGYESFDPFAFSMPFDSASDSTSNAFPDFMDAGDLSSFPSTSLNTAPTISPIALTASPIASGSFPSTSLPPAPPQFPPSKPFAAFTQDRRASVPFAFPRIQPQAHFPFMYSPDFAAPVIPPADYTSFSNGSTLLDTPYNTHTPLFPNSTQLFQQAVDSVRPHTLQEVLQMNQTLYQGEFANVNIQPQPQVMGAPEYEKQNAGMGLQNAQGLGLMMAIIGVPGSGIEANTRTRSSV